MGVLSNMKRLLYLIILTSVLFSLSGCQKSITQLNESTDNKLKVVTTIFPQYDFVRQVAGDNVELTMLLAPGSESHSFDPSPQDIITIQNCDVFIYVGGESETWVDKILNSMDTSNMTIISLMDSVEVVEEVIVEGMQEDHSHLEDVEIEDVQNRTLSDWNGIWKPVLPYVEDGTLDEYMELASIEREETVEETLDYYLNKYATEYTSIEIKDNQVTMISSASGKASAMYEYQGFSLVDTNDSKQVWYQFELADGSEEMPQRLVFNDHTIGTEAPSHAHGVAHFHLNYGNESFEELIQNQAWSPSFYEIDATGEEILEVFLDHSHETELDEHVWTSLKNAIQIVKDITETLSSLDEEHRYAYEQHAEEYIEQLNQLDQQFEEVVSNTSQNILLFGDRFPFRYFADDYGLDYYAAFPGCSNETNASAGTVAFLIDKVKAEQIPVVLHLELSSGGIAKTIAEETGAETAVFHSAHNITRDDFNSGKGYLDLMKENLEVLKEVLK